LLQKVGVLVFRQDKVSLAPQTRAHGGHEKEVRRGSGSQVE